MCNYSFYKLTNHSLFPKFNDLFPSLEKSPIKSLNDLANAKTIFNICTDVYLILYKKSDKAHFSGLHLIFDESFGIKYAEINELITKTIEFLKKVNYHSKLKTYINIVYSQN